MILHDWFDISNWWVGVAGLGLTGGTMFLAKGAKAAATEARKAVRLRNAADAFAELARFARQLGIWIAAERYSEARVQLHEIVFHLAQDGTEYLKMLKSDAGRLNGIRNLCLELDSDLAEDPVSVSRRDVAKKTLQIENGLSTILGRMRAKVNEEER
ncbi:MAG: hypothetical protein P4K86_10980 [Terracidiphilus sp.]|nr:hypothetical protein [Terracidiphilus sp.]